MTFVPVIHQTVQHPNLCVRWTPPPASLANLESFSLHSIREPSRNIHLISHISGHRPFEKGALPRTMRHLVQARLGRKTNQPAPATTHRSPLKPAETNRAITPPPHHALSHLPTSDESPPMSISQKHNLFGKTVLHLGSKFLTVSHLLNPACSLC